MAARVAAQLRKETGVEVETVKGELGEFSVFIDDERVIETTRFWYPSPSKIVAQARALLAARRT